MQVRSSENPIVLGQSVVITATVGGNANAVPGGRVLFMLDGEVVGDPAGVPVTFWASTSVEASLSLPNPARGRHQITATYLGDQMFKGSTAALTQIVN